MKKPKPLIKFNGANPVALCNRCFVMMCYVSYKENEDSVVLEIKTDNDGDLIKTPLGQIPPSYCEKCNKLLSYSINE